MNYGKTVAIGLFIPLLFLFTCASQKEAISQPLPEGLTKSVEQRTAWEMEWEKVQKEAKKEQQLVIFSASSGETRLALTRAMKEKFDINVEWLTAAVREIQAKILAENRAGLTTADVVIAGASTGFNLKPYHIVEPLDKILLLPEVINPSKWEEGRFPWWDQDHFIIIGLINMSPTVAINTQLVRENELVGYRDLLNPKWKEKISMTSPLIGGNGLGSFGMIGEYIMGWDYFRELAKQEPVIITDTRLGVEWLARGKHAVAWAARSESMAEFQEAGAPVKYLRMKEGGYVSDSGLGFVKLKGSPHKAASVVFINWLLTQEGQTILSKSRGFESLRIDVPKDHIDSIRLRSPGVKYFTQDETARALQDAWLLKAEEILRPLMR